MSGCEWDPETSQPATDEHHCGSEATLSVGANGKWHLCASCAALPEFKRLRKRVSLKKPGTSRDAAIRDTDTGRVWVEREGEHWLLNAGIESDFDDDVPSRDSHPTLTLNRPQRNALIRALGGTP